MTRVPDMFCIPHRIPACRVCESYSIIENKLSKKKQPTALWLAHWLERDGANCQAHIDAAAELRRLHNIELALRDCKKALEGIAKKYITNVDQRDDIIRTAREAEMGFDFTAPGLIAELQRFAVLFSAAERERILDILERLEEQVGD